MVCVVFTYLDVYIFLVNVILVCGTTLVNSQWGATPSDKKVGWGGPTNQSATFTSSLPTTNNDQEEDGFEEARVSIGIVFM